MKKAEQKIIQGDALEVLKTLESETVQTCVTSPPYFGLRDYGHKGQIGLEETPEAYVAKLVELFREVKRVLRNDGTLWLNLGDSYASTKVGNTNGTYGKVKQKAGVNDDTRVRTIPPGLKQKNLIGIPWRVAFALQADGWYLRQDIIWHKPNPMPESVTDRCTKAHEYIFLLSKSPSYYYNTEAIKERGVMQSAGSDQRDTQETHGLGSGNSGINAAKARMKEELRRNGYVMRNKRSVWTVTTKPYKGAHFATFPPALIEPCILAGAPKNGIVLDPFFGSGTTGAVAKKLDRDFIGIELNPEYVKLAEQRLADTLPPQPTLVT